MWHYDNQNHNHNHNRSQNHNHNHTSDRYNGNETNDTQMSNFDPLPTTPPYTSCPGIPPFDIISTPLFDPGACDYSLHPDTLRHIQENANSFGLPLSLSLYHLYHH